MKKLFRANMTHVGTEDSSVKSPLRNPAYWDALRFQYLDGHCPAFTAKHKRCTRSVCQQHTDFYDAHTWHQQHPPGGLSDETFDEYAFAFANGLVPVDRDLVDSLATHQLPFYLVLCSHPAMRPTWNMELFGEAIRRYARFMCQDIDRREDIVDLYPTLSQNRNWSMGMFLLKAMDELLWLGKADVYIEELALGMLRNEDMRVRLLLSDAEHTIPYLALERGFATKRSLHVWERVVAPLLSKHRTAWKQERKAAMDVHREELCAAAWHPSRLDKWLAAGWEPATESYESKCI
jgi:hypothetical protein